MGYRELIIGAGYERRKMAIHPMRPKDWVEPTTLDLNPRCKPDILFDLDRIGTYEERIPLIGARLTPDDHYDEIHAYEVLEHLGTQGDYRGFFALFSELWRITKPGGIFCATVPRWDSEQTWGDPSHRRAITPVTIVFLNQQQYLDQIDNAEQKTAMTDFRYMYSADWQLVCSELRDEKFCFLLEAVKPSRMP